MQQPDSLPRNIDGYVGDSLYPSSFHADFSPSSLDVMLLHAAIQPPRCGKQSFTMVDIGCGDGLGLIAHAASCPDAHFVGIDAMPGHIERGQRIIAELGLDNIELRCETFSDALSAAPIAADYAAVQGVWSWISPQNQDAMLKLISHSLNPDGIAAIGYNCLPGWTPIASFQKLVGALAEGLTGSPTERFDQAVALTRAASKAGMAVIGEEHFEWLAGLQAQLPADYFAHEYLNGHWQPLWSGEAIATAATHDLHFVGPARPDRLRDDFAFKKAQREQLQATINWGTREIMADMFLNCWFRVDLYSRGPAEQCSETAVKSARLDSFWIVNKPPSEAEYRTQTAAGTIRFDNQSAQAILKRLDNGPASLRQICDSGEAGTAADILNVADALFIAKLITPVNPSAANSSATRFNQWLLDPVHKMPPINAIATQHGPLSAPAGEIAARIGDINFRTRCGLDPDSR